MNQDSKPRLTAGGSERLLFQFSLCLEFSSETHPIQNPETRLLPPGHSVHQSRALRTRTLPSLAHGIRMNKFSNNKLFRNVSSSYRRANVCMSSDCPRKNCNHFTMRIPIHRDPEKELDFQSYQKLQIIPVRPLFMSYFNNQQVPSISLPNPEQPTCSYPTAVIMKEKDDY